MSFIQPFIGTSYIQHYYSYWESLVFIVLIPLGFALGRPLFSLYYKMQIPDFSLHVELVERDNKAVAVAFTGFEVGMGLVMWGALSDLGDDHGTNVWSVIVWTLIGIVFLMIAVALNDHVVLRNMGPVKQVQQGNVAAAFAVAGNYIAAGLVSLYTIGGGDSNWGDNIASAVLFFVLCQIEFVVCHIVIDVVYRRYGSLNELVKEQNAAAGTLIFLSRIALGILALNPLRASGELVAYISWFGCSLIALPLFDLFVHHVVLYKIDGVEEFKNGNWGIACVQGAALFGASIAALAFLAQTCNNSAVKGLALSSRLTLLDQTYHLFSWNNLVCFVAIMLYIAVSKVIFAVPHIIAGTGNADESCLESVTGFLRASTNFRDRIVTIMAKKPTPAKVRRMMETLIKAKKAAGAGAVGPRAEGQDAAPQSAVPEEGSEMRQTSVQSADLGVPRVVSKPPQGYDAPGGQLLPAILGTEPLVPGQSFEQPGKISASRCVSYSGYLISIGILVRSAYFASNSPSESGGYVLFYSMYWCTIGIILQHLGYFLMRLLLWGRKAPTSQSNLASGLIDGCMYITIGLQVGANLNGNNAPGPFDLGNDTATVLLFFVFQLTCIAIAGKIFQFTTKFDDVKCVADGNVAAALANGLYLLAAGVLSAQMATRSVEFVAFLAFFFPAQFITHLVRVFVVEKIIMVNSDLDTEILRDKNWGASLTSGSIAVLLSACLTSFLREICTPAPLRFNTINTTNGTVV